MDKPRHGGHVIAKVLANEGVKNLFTLSGGHIAPIYDGCVDEGIRIVDFRHEQAAAHAADGWARVTLQPGVAAVFADGMDRPLRIRVPFGGDREGPWAADDSEPLVQGRRWSACGPVCVAGRACTLLELRAADLQAGSPDDAWLRVWTEALVLAFLTNRPLPLVPASLRQRWAGLGERLRECLLATSIDRALQGRALAVRAWIDPERLAAATAVNARRMLGLL